MNLKELSAILGLSQTTVSRALNGYPEVNEKTRQTVQAAARAHNYRASATATGLATGRTLTIGHIIPVSSQHEIMNPIFADFVSGAGEIYSRNGYHMTLILVPDDDEEHAYRDFANQSFVDGVIVHGPRNNDARIALLKDIGLPFVVHGRSGTDDDSYSWVDVDNRGCFRRATEFLLDLGHRRIGLVNGLETMEFARNRQQGFVDAMAARGALVDHTLISSGAMTEVYGFQSANDILGQKTLPTALLVSSMIAAIGVRRAIERRGLGIPEDLSLVIFDDVLSYMHNGADVPIFTAVRSSVAEAGRLCAQTLLDMVREPGSPPRHILLDTDLVVGSSTGPRLN